MYENNPKLLNSTLSGGTWIYNPNLKEKASKLHKFDSEYGKTLIGEKNPFYGKKHSEETKEKIRQHHLGKTNEDCWKPIVINGLKYDNLQKAHEELGVPIVTISWRVNSSNPMFVNWYEVKDKRLLFPLDIAMATSLYEVEGKYYYSSKGLSEKYNIKQNTVSWRCQSKISLTGKN